MDGYEKSVGNLDAEEWADHLRLDGYPEEIIRGFERRAADDLSAALRWLGDQSPDEADVPFDEGFDDGFVDTSDLEYGGFWGVLADGLPPWPADIQPGQRFPVARWVDGDEAVILYVIRRRAGDYALRTEEHESEIVSFRRDAAGIWVEVGAAGSAWYDPFHPPGFFLDKYKVVLTGEAAGGGGLAVGGMCGADAAAVVVRSSAGTARTGIDPVRRVFVVASARLPAEVRLVDAAGETLTDCRGRPVSWTLGMPA